MKNKHSVELTTFISLSCEHIYIFQSLGHPQVSFPSPSPSLSEIWSVRYEKKNKTNGASVLEKDGCAHLLS